MENVYDKVIGDIIEDVNRCFMCEALTYKDDRVMVRNVTAFCFECIDLLNTVKDGMTPTETQSQVEIN